MFLSYSVLHMHQSGIHMKNEVLRGEEAIHTATSEVYDFEQQGAYHHPQGKLTNTRCAYIFSYQ